MKIHQRYTSEDTHFAQVRDLSLKSLRGARGRYGRAGTGEKTVKTVGAAAMGRHAPD